MERSSPDEKGVNAEVESLTGAKDGINVTVGFFGASRLEGELAFRVFKVAEREYRFAWKTSFNETGDLQKLKKSYALHQNLSLFLASHLYTSCIAQSRASSAHDARLEGNIGTAASFRTQRSGL